MRERGGVEYRELKARSLLNRCDSPRMPFTWTVNPYRGCAMGCRYCYATYTHEFMGIDGAETFHSLVYVKTGGEEETARRLAARGAQRRDASRSAPPPTPTSPAEAEAKVTRRFLEMVARHRNVRLGIVTKGALILRDLDLLRKIHERSRLSVHVSLDLARTPSWSRTLDPWAPPPDVRIEVMRRLVEAGIETCLGLAPVLPGHHRRRGEPGPPARARGRGRRAPHVHQRALPPLAHAREVPALAGGGVPALPRGLREGVRGRASTSRGRTASAIDAMVRRLKRKHGFVDAAGRPTTGAARSRSRCSEPRRCRVLRSYRTFGRHP